MTIINYQRFILYTLPSRNYFLSAVVVIFWKTFFIILFENSNQKKERKKADSMGKKSRCDNTLSSVTLKSGIIILIVPIMEKNKYPMIFKFQAIFGEKL